jgi:hypothetical protein
MARWDYAPDGIRKIVSDDQRAFGSTPSSRPAYGEEITDLPMSVFKHQLSHVRRPLARGRPEAEGRDAPVSKPSIRDRQTVIIGQ